MATIDIYCHITDAGHGGESLMTSMNISVPDAMREWVEAQIAAGRYGNVSEYFRDLVRKDQDEKAQMRLEALLLEGLQSGDPTPVTPEFWEKKKQELVKRFNKKIKKKS